jgi:uncharacterized lipoprotein YajG
MNRFSKSGVLLAAAIMVAGCAPMAPIQNVGDTPVTAVGSKRLTEVEVRSAIVRAGTGLGWIVKDAGPGKLNATLILRTHTAEVEIPYSTSSYSITYKSSINLQEANGKIHRNYNGWIQNLNRGINAQLAAS